MGDAKDIIDFLLRLQERFYKDVQQYYKQGEGRVSLLRVTGIDGETVLLKVENRRLKYAEGDETPIHIFRLSNDTFLDIIDNPTEQNIRSKWTKSAIVIEDAQTGSPNVVELEKWARAFRNLASPLKYYLKGFRKEKI